MHERILTLARAMVSPSSGEELLLDALVSSAQAQLASSLREGLAPEDCGDAFPCAAAMLAAAAFLPCREGDISSFTAGEIHVSTGSAGKSAQALRSQARVLMTPFAGDGGFAFMGVRG